MFVSVCWCLCSCSYVCVSRVSWCVVFFAVGVVKIWCSWFVVLVCSSLCVCVGVQGCAFVSVLRGVCVCRCSSECVFVTAKTETDKDTDRPQGKTEKSKSKSKKREEEKEKENTRELPML